jgi:hypothetical protein
MAAQIHNALDGNTGDINIQVEPRMVLAPADVTIDIYPADAARDSQAAAFNDINGGYLLTVRTRMATPDFDSTYDLLLQLMDDQDDLCIPLALLDDPTLNGNAQTLDVLDPTGLRAYERVDGSGADLGWQFTCNVIAAQS